jgi:hypothetical protein
VVTIGGQIPKMSQASELNEEMGEALERLLPWLALYV